MVSHMSDPWRHQGLGVRWADLLADLAEVPVGREWIQVHGFEVASILTNRAGIYSKDRAADHADQEALSILKRDWGIVPVKEK